MRRIAAKRRLDSDKDSPPADSDPRPLIQSQEHYPIGHNDDSMISEIKRLVLGCVRVIFRLVGWLVGWLFWA